LDSSNDFIAAISAYEESVKLLKEVMTRVEESATAWRQKEKDRLIARKAMGPETDAEKREREKRTEKLEKKEKDRLEEGRRLKVIVSLPLDLCVPPC